MHDIQMLNHPWFVEYICSWFWKDKWFLCSQFTHPLSTILIGPELMEKTSGDK